MTLDRDRFCGLVGIGDSAGRRLAVRRDALGRIVAVEGPAPDGGDAMLALVSFSYDAKGDLVAARDAAGGTFRYAYERHLLVEERRPAGLAFRFRYDDAALRTRARCVATWGDATLDEARIYDRALSYDDAARCTTVSSPRGAVERYEWNEAGRVVAHVDALGRRRTRRLASDGTLLAERRADGAERRYRHDAHGRVVERVDYDGSSRRIDYAGPDGDGVVDLRPAAITDPRGGVERFTWDGRGNLAAHEDAAGRVTRFVRDERGRTLRVSDALGVRRRLGWTGNGLLAHEAAGDGTRRIDYVHDALGRLVERRVAGGPLTRYGWDDAGRLVRIRRADGGTVLLERDAEGRVTRHRSAVGATTCWRYDGLPVPVQRRDPDGTSLRYRYDADLNLVGLINGKGEHYTLDYDLADRLVAETGVDGRVRRYAYDAAGFLAACDDAEDRGARYSRDPLGRLLECRRTDGRWERFDYAANGALVGAENEWGAVRFAYAPDGAVLAEAGPSGSIVHAYDARGRRTLTTLPDGRQIAIAHDDADNVAAIGFDGRHVATFERDAAGRETARQAGALAVTTMRDPQGRLARQSAHRSDGDTDVPVLERRYAWDVADRLTETVDLARGARRYAYDPSSRLVGVAGDLPERFVFDPAGNILGDGDGAEGVAPGDRLLVRGDRKFEYDACGNRVREWRGAAGGVERVYRYDAGNRLVAVEEQSRRGRRLTSFRYDALGRRCGKRSLAWAPDAANDDWHAERPVHDATTAFVWTGDVLLAESADPACDAFATVYLHEPGSVRPLAQIRRDARDASGSVYHYHLDQVGTPLEVTNDVGALVWQGTLKAWGALAATAVAAVAQPIRFPGQYHDVETGLHYNRFRYYAPDEGRFLEQDPIGLAGGPNLAAYPTNPTGRVDPFGLAPCTGLDNTPADQARAWQGSGDYPGVDAYTNTTLTKGTQVVGAAPGQSPYYTTLDEFNGQDGSAADYYDRLQIAPNTNPAYPPYRSGVTVYEVNGDTPAASGTALANPDNGAGQAPQYFIPGYQDKLTPLYSIPFRNQ